MSFGPGLAAAGVTLASALQAYVSLSLIRETERDVIDHWEARDKLLSEVKWWRPVRRARRRREIRKWIDQHESQQFKARFRRVRLTLFSWSTLVASSGYGAILAWTS